jgi:hypothetical protein
LVPLNELSTPVWSTPGIAPAGRLASGADLMGDVSRGHASEVEGSDSMMSYRLQAIDVLSDDVARNSEEIPPDRAGKLVLTLRRFGTARGGVEL